MIVVVFSGNMLGVESITSVFGTVRSAVAYILVWNKQGYDLDSPAPPLLMSRRLVFVEILFTFGFGVFGIVVILDVRVLWTPCVVGLTGVFWIPVVNIFTVFRRAFTFEFGVFIMNSLIFGCAAFRKSFPFGFGVLRIPFFSCFCIFIRSSLALGFRRAFTSGFGVFIKRSLIPGFGVFRNSFTFGSVVFRISFSFGFEVKKSDWWTITKVATAKTMHNNITDLALNKAIYRSFFFSWRKTKNRVDYLFIYLFIYTGYLS